MNGDSFITVVSQKHYVSLYFAGLDETLPKHSELATDLGGINRRNCLRFRARQLDRVTTQLIDELIEVTRDWLATRTTND